LFTGYLGDSWLCINALSCIHWHKAVDWTLMDGLSALVRIGDWLAMVQVTEHRCRRTSGRAPCICENALLGPACQSRFLPLLLLKHDTPHIIFSSNSMSADYSLANICFYLKTTLLCASLIGINSRVETGDGATFANIAPRNGGWARHVA
jgi:hypothetical protein